MSNLWINIRFGRRYLQIGPDWPWVSFKINPYWDYRTEGAPWFAIYTFRVFGL